MSEETQPVDDGLLDSIAMLEQILEVMPQDIMALKALYNAYCQCGRRDRAFEYLGLLADVVYAGNDSATAAFIVKQLQSFEEEYPSESAAQLARIRAVIAPEDQAAPAEPRPVAESKEEADISEELAMAWRLYEENQLSQEEYSSVIHDLTEVSSKTLNVPVSVLHVLNDRSFNQMDRIMNHMSSRSGVPCISLAQFELQEKVGSALPLEMATHDGALPFGFFGNDLLVAVLNPFNNNLVDKVENESGHRCHTYLVTSEEYDSALNRLRGLAAAAT